METLEALAKGLSEAQCSVLSRQFTDTRYAFYPGRDHPACRSLGRSGLLSETQDSIGNTMWRFTETGLALRAHLLAQKDLV